MPMVFPAAHIQMGPGYANLDANRQAVQSLLGSLAMLEETKKQRANEAVLARLATAQNPQEARSILAGIAAEREDGNSGFRGVLNRINPVGHYPHMSDIEQQARGSILGQVLDPEYEYKKQYQKANLARIAADTEAAKALAEDRRREPAPRPLTFEQRKAIWFDSLPPEKQQEYMDLEFYKTPRAGTARPMTMSQAEVEYFETLSPEEQADYLKNRGRKTGTVDPNQKRREIKLKNASARANMAYNNYLQVLRNPYYLSEDDRTAAAQAALAEYEKANTVYEQLSMEDEPQIAANPPGPSPLGESLPYANEFDSPYSDLNQPKAKKPPAGRQGRARYAKDPAAFERVKDFIRSDPQILMELDAADFSEEQLAELKTMMGN